ncbi:hypothetical protein DRG94_22380 [Escherichia coli]|nr:hypothetical protein [Escherichia coli]EEW3417917.1 hypothetical protein [Escherichia coli]EFC4581964.1 hypothetical protein [Escherichia coli]EFO0995734.1 hypothetical protein [Escherichia coli]NNR49602.1 hypothetical protein [Escherichia coli]
MIKDNSKADDSADRLSFTETLFVAHSILPDLTQTKTKENDCYLLFKKVSYCPYKVKRYFTLCH